MKTRFGMRWANSGSVLIITLLISVILGITLGGYLYWVRTQNLLVAESQAWNSALVIAEAGIEEGMAQINVLQSTDYAGSYPVSMATNNWPQNRSLANGSY